GVWYGTPGVVINAFEADENGIYRFLNPRGIVVRGPRSDPNVSYVYLSGNFAAAYSTPDAPGAGGSVSELNRQVVYVRPDLVFVYDRVTTIKDTYTKKLQWTFLNPPAVSGNAFVETVGNSSLFGQMYSEVPITTSAAAVTIGDATVQVMDTQNTSPTA